MPSLREIRRRIASTKDIQKITKAMQTVAGVRLRRAQNRLFAARPYARKLDEMMKHLAAQTADERVVLKERRHWVRRVMQDLSPRDRLLLALRYQDDRPPGDIAPLLGLAPGTTRKALHDAVARLRRKLRAAQPELFPAPSAPSDEKEVP